MDKQLTLKIKAMTHNGELPRYPTEFKDCSIVNGGDRCCACGKRNPHHTYALADNRRFSFHKECEHVWRNAQMKPV